MANKVLDKNDTTKNVGLIVQKEGHSTKICPVCGEPGTPVDRTPNPKYPHLVYRYYEHAVKLPSGRWGAKYCYVGRVTHSTKSAENATSASSHSAKNIVQKVDANKTSPPGEPTHSTNFCTMSDMFERAKYLPGYRSKGYTTLGDMKRLGLIISDFSAEELDRWEEEGLTGLKNHLNEKVGSIYYRCECGEKIDQVDLFFKHKGKCPKCGKQIVKKENWDIVHNVYNIVHKIEKVKERKKCGNCEFFVPAKGLDVGVCRKTGKTKHESEFCDSNIPGLIPSKIETSPQEALLNRFLLEARKKLTKGQIYKKHK
ncbi:hypothetical protein DRO69_00370 [Candidatus Bathyarchaeota archaeon]|nr:MAG: hypothetical protein DRO69_00370 [Candidatus Bathyarchaeota archaeon]